jgi:hypothetical protein
MECPRSRTGERSEGLVAATLRATAAAERTTLDAGLPEALVLRYGWFYGPGTAFAADGGQTEMVRKRRYPVIGDAYGRSSTSTTRPTPRWPPSRRT